MNKLIQIVAILTFVGVPIFGQFMPCIYDASPPGELKWVYAPAGMILGSDGQWHQNTVRMLQHVPDWEPRIAFSEPSVQVNPLGIYFWTFYMPARGRCVGAFDSYAKITAANQIGRTMVGQYTGIPMGLPTGDVEVLVLAQNEFEAWKRGRSTTTRGGSHGLEIGGTFSVDLDQGWYYLVISNQHSGFTGKVVSIRFGGTLPGTSE